MEKYSKFMVCLMVGFLLLSAGCFGAVYGIQIIRNDAIEAGVAEWRCDKHGQTTFHFLERREP